VNIAATSACAVGFRGVGRQIIGRAGEEGRNSGERCSLRCFSNQPVAEIVQCGEPSFARAARKLRLGVACGLHGIRERYGSHSVREVSEVRVWPCVYETAFPSHALRKRSLGIRNAGAPTSGARSRPISTAAVV